MMAQLDDSGAERARLQVAANQHLADARANFYPEPVTRMMDADDITPSDIEILDVLVETFGMTHAQAVDRLSQMDFTAMREQFEVAELG